MSKILAPDKLNVEANQPTAEKVYRHCRKTFDNFLEECGEAAPDKLRCLTKYVTAQVYEYFSEATTYEAAIDALDKIYIRPKNEIFSRHLLAKR